MAEGGEGKKKGFGGRRSFRLRKGGKGYRVKQKKENVLRERKFVKECSTEIEAGDKVKTSRGFCQSRL